MKTNYFLYPLFAILLLAALALNACKKEKPPCQDPSNPTCENYDPCYGKKTINTFFKVREGDNGFKPPEEWCQLIPCDTFNTSSVRFDAPDGNPANSTYEWQIGTEVNPRKGKGLEVDFYDYLRDNGWERWIPIKLTIRTPLNSCLTNLRDTFVTVERELFFTEKQIAGLFIGITEREEKFVGTLNGVPNSEIKLIQKRSGSFRGYTPPIYLLTGIPYIDTLVFPTKCYSEGCLSYRQARGRFPTFRSCMEDVTFYLSEHNHIFSNERKELELDLTFDPPDGRIQFSFKGKLEE
jgi:hypothetical protein